MKDWTDRLALALVAGFLTGLLGLGAWRVGAALVGAPAPDAGLLLPAAGAAAVLWFVYFTGRGR